MNSERPIATTLYRLYRRTRTRVRRLVVPDQLDYYRWYRGSILRWADKPEAVTPQFEAFAARGAQLAALQIAAQPTLSKQGWSEFTLPERSDPQHFERTVYNLPFKDASFELLACEDLVQHAREPRRVIAELSRILRPGGEIWLSVPLCRPHGNLPGDYWRVTHKGILIWMKDYEAVASGLLPVGGTPFYNDVYFHGRSQR